MGQLGPNEVLGIFLLNSISFSCFLDLHVYDRRLWCLAANGGLRAEKIAGPKMGQLGLKMGREWGLRQLFKLWQI